MLEEFFPWLNTLVLLLLVVCALAVVRLRSLLASTVMMGIFSLLMAVQYLMLGAPDVAITEAAVGAGISSILLLLALFQTQDQEKTTKHVQWGALCIVLVVFAALILVTTDMPYFGYAFAPAHMHVAPYYLNISPSDIGIPNVVTSILASYRGFDTFGETVVVFTAAVSIMLLLAGTKKQKGKK